MRMWLLSVSCTDVIDELKTVGICLFHWIIMWDGAGRGVGGFRASCFSPPAHFLIEEVQLRL